MMRPAQMPQPNISRRKPAKRAFHGLAGSPLSTAQTDAPAMQRTVLQHFCFDQRAGEARPGSCACKGRINLEAAMNFVKEGQADWLFMKTRSGGVTKSSKAIVIRREVLNSQVLFAIECPLKPDPSNKKHEAIKDGIRMKSRQILEKLVATGRFPQSMAALSDAELETLFEKEPSKKLVTEMDEQGQVNLRQQWDKVFLEWWVRVLGYGLVNPSQGQFLAEAEEGKGKPILSGGSKEIELIWARADYDEDGSRDTRNSRNIGRVAVANARASKWNGEFDHSTGADPHEDDNGSDEEGASE